MHHSRIRRALLFAGLLALALPASAAASTVSVAPPEAVSGGSVSAAATTDDGCEARTGILFREGEVLTPVRHVGRMRCGVPTRIACRGKLTHLTTDTLIARDRDSGNDRCRYGSSFEDSERYAIGERFRESARYRLTLRDPDHTWSGTSEFCPERRRQNRVLICRDSFRATAPESEVVSRG